jgi:predicted transcriptional regulator
MVSIVDVISAVSNDKALSLFKTIAQSENYDTNMLIAISRLERKLFYSIMKKLMDVGLVKRVNGRYRLTSLGKIVYRAQARVEIGIENHWKLKALDSVIMSAGKTGLSVQERQMFIDKLIDNHEIKSILLSE